VPAVIEGLPLPGQALPSSRLPAQSLGLSRTTATLALQVLADKRLIHGCGPGTSSRCAWTTRGWCRAPASPVAGACTSRPATKAPRR
jgi:DNA-binding transcriptional MocR family regulator